MFDVLSVVGVWWACADNPLIGDTGLMALAEGLASNSNLREVKVECTAADSDAVSVADRFLTRHLPQHVLWRTPVRRHGRTCCVVTPCCSR